MRHNQRDPPCRLRAAFLCGLLSAGPDGVQHLVGDSDCILQTADLFQVFRLPHVNRNLNRNPQSVNPEPQSVVANPGFEGQLLEPYPSSAVVNI